MSDDWPPGGRWLPANELLARDDIDETTRQAVREAIAERGRPAEELAVTTEHEALRLREREAALAEAVSKTLRYEVGVPTVRVAEMDFEEMVAVLEYYVARAALQEQLGGEHGSDEDECDGKGESPLADRSLLELAHALVEDAQEPEPAADGAPADDPDGGAGPR